MQIFQALIVSFILSFSSVFAQTIGKPAPDFSVQGHDGKTYSLKDLKGKYVVLEWFNPYCPYVKKQYEAGNMQKLQKTAKDNKTHPVVWLSVSSAYKGHPTYLDANKASKYKENPADLDATKAGDTQKDFKGNMNAILLDETGAMGKAYAASATPHMFIIDPNGILLYQGGIDSENSLKPESIKTAKHPYFYDALFNHVFEDKAIAKDMASTKAIGCSIKYKPIL